VTAIGDSTAVGTADGMTPGTLQQAAVPRWLLWFAIVGVVAGQLVHHSALDRAWLLWLHQRPFRGDDAWLFLTQMGDSAWVLLVLLSLGVGAAAAPQRLAWLLRAWLLGAVVSPVLKRLWDTSRPLSVLDPALLQVVGQPAAGHHAMPSGHAMAAGTWVALWFCMLPDTARGRVLRGLMLLSGLAVAVSRVAVGAHWPGDVLTGFGLGVLLTGLAVYLESRRPWAPRLSAAWVWPALLSLQAVLLWVLWQQPWEGAGKQIANALGLVVALASALGYGLQRRQHKMKGPHVH